MLHAPRCGERAGTARARRFGCGTRVAPHASVACSAIEAAGTDPPAPPPRRRGRPSIYASLSLNLVMPSQFFREGGDEAAPGERRLMCAVLKDALDLLFKYDASEDRRGGHLFAEAQRWVQSDDAGWPFAFLNVCDALGLDPSSVREGLARCLAARRAPRRPR